MAKRPGRPNGRALQIERRLRQQFGDGYNGVIRGIVWVEKLAEQGKYEAAIDGMAKLAKYVYPTLASVQLDVSDDRPVFNVDLRGLKRVSDDVEVIEGEVTEASDDEVSDVQALPQAQAPRPEALEIGGKGGYQGQKHRKTPVDQWVEENVRDEG